ncbi:MAG: tRNA (adenosine(37)-N6)-threonylcarbamoyltransferase complex dimerization subunit type 1 TsaB [Candidatus Omnitrophica bacterium]|nr:tRNA (adenosine(37)-N6)-threonylcarbamoyltransferase complex dimerization subunit type 1 TsaB [Candidatus Omnitrophota bacterium]
MRILSINTTSRVMDVALSSNGKIFGIERDIRLNDYEGIVSLIKLILKRSRLKLEQIDYFGACNGPGSFTGIRIGLSVMKALAYSTGRPLIGFRSLDLLAWMAKDKFSGLLCIMQDARRNNIYSAVFSNNRGLRKISPYLLLGISQLLREIKKLNRKKIDLYFYGDIVSYYKDDIKKFFPSSILLQQQEFNLKSQAIISLTKDNIKQKCNSFELLPFYMYPKDCQVRKPVK